MGKATRALLPPMGWMLVSMWMLVLAVWPSALSAQASPWNDAMDAASRALEESRYEETEKRLRIAVE